LSYHHQTEWLAYLESEARSREDLKNKHHQQQTALGGLPFDAHQATALLHQQLSQLIDWLQETTSCRAAIQARHLKAEANPLD
jgi:hypothetical protein